MSPFKIGLLLVLISGKLFSQTYKNQINPAEFLNSVPDYPNETMDYKLYYGFIKIGAAHLEFNNKQCNNAYIVAEAKSTGLVKFVKDINYRYECCMDTITGLPFFDSRILIEGEYEDLNTVYYNHYSRRDSAIIYSAITDSVVVPKGIYDLLSGFYHYRTNYIPYRLNSTETASITTYFIDNVWNLSINYLGSERIQTIFGKKECYVIKPKTVVGHFFSKPDAMTIWLTKDQYKIPVRFCLEFKIGTLWGRLESYQKPDNQLPYY